MENLKNIAVIYGGSSSEREISIQSGLGVHQAILDLGYKSFLKDFNDLDDLANLKDYDMVFIALHGIEGEGGKLQQDLASLGIKYTGSSSIACQNTWNKWKCKEILASKGISTPRGFTCPANELESCSPFEKFRTIYSEIPDSLFMKPEEDGSSVDIYEIKNDYDYHKALGDCKNMKRSFIFEEAIRNREFTVTIIDKRCFPIIEIKTDNQFYDYDAKYLSDETSMTEANSSVLDLEAANKIAINAYNALGCIGWARVDLLQDENGVLYVIEINTVPGMTSHSCVPKSGSFINLSYQEIVQKIINA